MTKPPRGKDEITEDFAVNPREFSLEDREEEGVDEKRVIEGAKGEEGKEEEELLCRESHIPLLLLLLLCSV